ncbi:spore germination protein [Tissierella pigra]|uniref:Spore germination protein n=1 Tax=Tissierella pigra TaxID=2607614 RepID=A0A6N7XDS4_9FIRM|nr:spore germination protein [Tissierella pigra]MSU00201.1 spore germination protein [Tissierella pigra]
MKNLQDYNISYSLDENINLMKEIFKDDNTLKIKKLQNQFNPNMVCCIFFINGMVDENIISEYIIKPIITNRISSNLNQMDTFQDQIIMSCSSEKTKDISKLVDAVLMGNTALFLECENNCLIIKSQGWQTRNIEEPTVEKALRGPREGFNECLMVNLSMIRRKIKSNKLKFNFMTIGDITNTDICIAYIEGLAEEKILENLYSQLNAIKIDGILDVKYIQEYIDKEPFSIFETTGSTEKPDVVASKLLEGRIAVLVDGSPVVMTLPYIFIELFQSADDYSLNYYFSSINRILRIFGFLSTISIPPIYLALVTQHQEFIPTPLMMSIYASRISTPLPTILELTGLLIVFEELREAGARMPSFIGQALSIVGALVLGTAAVDARFVSAPIIIVVGMSGIAGLITPNLNGASNVIKIALIFLSSILGLYGYIIGMTFLLIHLFKLDSFGIPYMSNLTTFNMQSLKDTAVRFPAWYMRLRPRYMTNNHIRSNGGKNHE